MKALIAVGGTNAGKPALALLAKLGFPSLELHLVHVKEGYDPPALEVMPYPGSDFARRYAAMKDTEGREALAAASAFAAARGLGTPTQEMFEGFAANEILRRADELGADLIALSSEAQGRIASVLVGSMARKLAIAAHQSLLIGRAIELPTWSGTAVFATDHSPYANSCLDLLVDLAPKGLRQVRLLTVYDPISPSRLRAAGMNAGGEAEREIRHALVEKNRAAGARLARLGCAVEPVVALGDIRAEIRREMERSSADLLILGAQGHGFLQRLKLGSTSLGEVVTADYPILLVRLP